MYPFDKVKANELCIILPCIIIILVIIAVPTTDHGKYGWGGDRLERD